MMPLQAGDVPETWADINELIHQIDYRPKTDIESGVNEFINWYLDYYRLKRT